MKRLNKSRFNKGDKVVLRKDIPPFPKGQIVTVTDPYKSPSFRIEVTNSAGTKRRVPCGPRYLRLA